MRSNKSRVAALVLSLVMAVTAVPSFAIAEDFTDGGAVQDGWDVVTVVEPQDSEFDYSTSVEEPAIEFNAFSEPVEAFDDSVVFDDAEVADAPTDFDIFDFAEPVIGIDDAMVGASENAVDLDLKSVTFYYNDTRYEDFTVTYLLKAKGAADVTGSGTPVVLKNAAKISSDTPATCTSARTVVLEATIPSYPEYGTFKSDKFLIGDPLGHRYGAPYTVIDKQANCLTRETGTGHVDAKCGNCGKLLSEFKTSTASCKTSDGTSTTCKAYYDSLNATAITVSAAHDNKLVSTTYVATKPATATLDPEGTEAPVTATATALLKNAKFVDANTVPTAVDTSQDFGYYVVKTNKCTKCGTETVTYSFKTESILKKYLYPLTSDGNPTAGNFTNISSIGVATLESYFNSSDSYSAAKDVETEKILLKDCSKDGSYTVYYYKKDSAGKYVDNGKQTVIIPAHHTATLDADNKPVVKYAVTDENGKELTTSFDSVATIDPTTKEARSLSCKPVYFVSYVECQNFSNDKVYTTEKTAGVAAGNAALHIIDPKVNVVATGKTVGRVDEALAKGTPISGDDFAKLMGVKDLKNVDKVSKLVDTTGLVCGGTGEVKFLCANCGQEIPNKVLKVTLPSDTDLIQAQTATVYESKDASCEEDGYIKSAKICPYPWCQNKQEESTKVLPKKAHEFDPDFVTVLTLPTGEVVIDDEASPLYKNKGKEVKEKFFTEDDKTTGAAKPYRANVIASLYKVCKKCGKEVLVENTNAEDDYDDVKYTIVNVVKNAYRCKAGAITITATGKYNNKTVTDTKTYEYWNSPLDYAARTSHEPDATGLKCKICGDPIIPETPTIATEPVTESSTEVQSEKQTASETETQKQAEETTEPTTEASKMPAQVMGLKVTKNSPTKKVIAVKYSAVDDADQYTVNVRKAGTTAWTKNLTDGAVTAYEITGLTRGEAYDIRVAAIAKGIAGPRSGHLYRWLEKVTLEKPKRLSATSVSISWNDVGASKYKVYYSTDKSFKTGVKTGVVKDNGAIITELTPGKYYFKVRCYKTIDGITYTGAWSNVKSKTMK